MPAVAEHIPSVRCGSAMTKEEFAVRLRELREAKGLSRGDLAERAGVSEDAIALWEQALREPSMGNFCAIADALGVSTEDLRRPGKGTLERRKPGRPKKGKTEPPP